jgi:uncharacterized Zn-finger protein
MNLDFLIMDSRKATTELPTEETFEFGIPSPTQLAKCQFDEFPGPLISPEQNFSKRVIATGEFNSTEELSPLSQLDAYKGARALTNRFACNDCHKSYSGKRELTRHMKKHNSPNKFSCSIDGCLHSTYRIDAMRCHIRAHEKRLKIEMARKRDL